MGLLEAGQWFALAWLLLSIPVSLVAGRLLARNNARYPLVRAPRPGERVASVHQLHPRSRTTAGRLAAVGLTSVVVATISVGTAAAFGGLPAPAQSATASVIEAISPFTVPHESPTPSAAARSRAAAPVVDAARAPARTQPATAPARTPGGQPAPVPGIAVPTVAPQEPAAAPQQTSPATAAPAPSTPQPVAPSPVDPGTPDPTTPPASPDPTATPSGPTPTDEPSPTDSPSPTSAPTPTDPASPGAGAVSPTPDPSPTATPTGTPGPAPTP